MSTKLSKEEIIKAISLLSKEEWLNVQVEILSNCKVLELAELKKLLETTWGVQAVAAVAQVAVAAAPGGNKEEAAESTEFEVTLVEFPEAKKIGIIKVIREVTGLGLKEARDLAEGAPKVLKPTASKAEAEEIVKKFAEVNGKITLKGL